MSIIYTPGGLKIRLDPDRVERMLAPAGGRIDLHEAYLDVELWAGFPQAFSFVWSLIAFALAFTAANIFQQFTYSRILCTVFPTFLGGWIIAIPASVAAGVYLYFFNALLVGLIQFVIVVANWMHYTDIFLIVLMPIRLAIRKITGVMIGDVEIAFMRILTLQARRAGIEINWNIYNRQSPNRVRDGL
jgi:hypothetical protein